MYKLHKSMSRITGFGVNERCLWVPAGQGLRTEGSVVKRNPPPKTAGMEVKAEEREKHVLGGNLRSHSWGPRCSL